MTVAEAASWLVVLWPNRVSGREAPTVANVASGPGIDAYNDGGMGQGYVSNLDQPENVARFQIRARMRRVHNRHSN